MKDTRDYKRVQDFIFFFFDFKKILKDKPY